MHSRDRTPPALKHGAYSATAILPGESQAEFEKLHRDTIAEWTPSGVLENDIVMTITRLLWRKQNLDTLRIEEEKRQARISEKFGDDYKLVELGEAATFDGLRKELDIIERFDSAITRCLKQLLLVRGVKSISAAPSSASSKRISGPPKAA